MITSEQIHSELAPQLQGDVLVSDLALVAYSTAACIYRIRPLAVVLPKSADDVSKVVRYALAAGLPVIPRGAGSGLAGQVLGEGIVLDFTRYMNQVEEVRPEDNYIRVQPGAILGTVNESLKPLNKRIPQDPASEAMCSIGGNVGNNAGGLRAFRIGSTKHHVRGLQVVLSDGAVAWIRPVAEGSLGLQALESDQSTLGQLYRETDRVLRQNEALIAEHRPRMEKNTAGYDIFSVYHDGLVDLTRLIVGSEGGLAVVTDVELALIDLPARTATALLYFDSLEKAGEAVHEILTFTPLAVEFMEKNFLDVVRSDGAIPADFLPAEAQAVLLVEFALESDEANRQRLQAMTHRITDDLHLAFTAREAYETKQQARLWALRKAALPILHKLPPPRQITAFIEDSVVPPERLAEYIHSLWAIFDRHGIKAAMYGHAGDANLHVRPLLNLRSQEDIDTMRALADEVADLVLSVGGTLSGEHGDGRVRSPYLRRQFGALYNVMREIKRIWDPNAILAPENVITDRKEIDTEHLKYGADYRVVPTGVEYDHERLRLEIEKCHGCGTCLAHCPAYKVTGELFAGPRAKVNVLKAAITGELPFDRLGLDPDFKRLADLCYNCKTCRVECPSGVDTPALMLTEKAHWTANKGSALADRMFSQARLMGKLGSLFAPLSNRIASLSVVQKLNRAMAGIAERPLPQFDHDNLERLPMPAPEVPAGKSARKVALFAGCFEMFNDPDAGRALVNVLAALGCEVILPYQRCCGLPAWTSGNRKSALADMHFNVDVFAPLARAGYTILSGCPSCVLSLREDYPEALEGDEAAQLVSRATEDVHAFVARLLLERTDLPFTDNPFTDTRLAYHAPCHLRAMGLGTVPAEMLQRAGGIKFALVNTTCCGMGGTFGMKQANLETSLAIGQELFDRLRKADIQAVVTPCGMCKTQISSGTGLPVHHPLEVLAHILRRPALAAT